MSNPHAQGGQSGKSARGFASMSPEKQRAIASKGGHAAHAKGTAHEFTSEEARVAGRKGGEAVSRDRAHMAAIGREGGQKSHRNRAMRGGPAGLTTRRGTESDREESETTTGEDEEPPTERRGAIPRTSERGGGGSRRRDDVSSETSARGNDVTDSRDTSRVDSEDVERFEDDGGLGEGLEEGRH